MASECINVSLLIATDWQLYFQTQCQFNFNFTFNYVCVILCCSLPRVTISQVGSIEMECMDGWTDRQKNRHYSLESCGLSAVVFFPALLFVCMVKESSSYLLNQKVVDVSGERVNAQYLLSVEVINMLLQLCSFLHCPFKLLLSRISLLFSLVRQCVNTSSTGLLLCFALQLLLVIQECIQ